MKKNKKSWLQIISSKLFIRSFLIASIFISLFFTTYKNSYSPPCVNADEVAFGYSAYSILKTGKDEYGHFLPLRLKSFGDYKMPLYSYLSIPFVGFFGLNELGVRSLNVVLGFLLPIVVYFLAKELFEKEEISAIAAVLVSISLILGIIERQAHEAILAVFLISLSGYFFVRFLKSEQYKFVLLFVLPLFLSLFSYQSSRLFALFFLIYAIIHFIQKKKITKIRSFFMISFVVMLIIFAITDFIYKPERVKNLFLISNPGYSLRVLELVGEGGSRIPYNKFALGAKDIIFQELQYLSPQFLAINGDRNYRFGFPGMSPMTPVEYLFIFVGLYYLFKNKERFRYFILFILVISPLTAALSWNEGSITRSLFLIIPALLISSYGAYNFLFYLSKKRLFPYVLIFLAILESTFLYYSWDFYINHYPKRALVARSWQCGYSELSTYIKNNYKKFDKFYITQKNGEPYIFLLYYLNFPPEKYQKQAKLTSPDKYGFGQVEGFDKFIFSFPPSAIDEHKVSLIGYPDDFGQVPQIDKRKIKKITVGHEDIFWIYENE